MTGRFESSAALGADQKTARQLKMDVLVGTILLAGVLLSLALVTIGLFWTYLRTGRLWLDYRVAGMNLFQFVVSEIRMAERVEVRPRLFVNGGIVVLMMTPYLRVVASMIYFMAALKNWKYSLFTGFVLAVLTFSLFLRT